MVAQDKVDWPIGQRCQRRQGGTKNVALSNIARDDQRVGLLIDRLEELPPCGFSGMIEMDVGGPGESHLPRLPSGSSGESLIQPNADLFRP